MGNKAGVAALGPYILRVQSGMLLSSNDVASEVQNFVHTPEGTLRSITGPAALIYNTHELVDGPQESQVLQLADSPSLPAAGSSPSVGPVIKYATGMHGLFHATLRDGERDVLLLHTGSELWEFEGWNHGWRKLISETAPTRGVSAELVDKSQPRFPTQFESTDGGVVIVPQDNRAFYYDGRTIAPLGFSIVPGPPQPKGPSNSRITASDRGVGINDIGYAHDGTPWDPDRTNYQASATQGFGTGRVGTLSELTFDASVFKGSGSGSGANDHAFAAGWIQRSEYRCRVQYIDVFGNLSAASAPSDSVEISFQPSEIPDPGTATDADVVNVDLMRKQIAWVNIATGPNHCIGRNLYRTKDMIGSGDQKYYRHTQNTQGLMSDFATLPDNVSHIYPDNIPDAFLARPLQEVDQVPTFRLCRLCFGRLWIANSKDDPGMVRPSMVGRYGTFPSDNVIYPDPAGGEITGLASTPHGLLAFTRSSTFLINTSGDGFSTVVVSNQIGCEAPSSIATLDDGRVFWLGASGFYAWDGSQAALVSNELREFFKQITPARRKQAVACFDPTAREYRCWVATNASTTNDTCLVYNGTGWSKRLDTSAEAVCLTKDHRGYMMVAGKLRDAPTAQNGVYVLDHSGNLKDKLLEPQIQDREAMIETTWLQSTNSLEKQTARVVNLWLRESENSKITVEVLRDWRETTIETVDVKKYSGADVPNFYETTALGAKDATFVRRRPYWTRAQVYVPSGETFKFRIKGTGDWEFIGLQVETTPRSYGGAQVPP